MIKNLQIEDPTEDWTLNHPISSHMQTLYDCTAEPHVTSGKNILNWFAHHYSLLVLVISDPVGQVGPQATAGYNDFSLYRAMEKAELPTIPDAT